MIPYLRPPLSLAIETGFFERLVEAGFVGDIETGADSRTVFATDNSIYQVEPSAVLFPSNTDDLKIIAAILSEEPFQGIVVAPRGGGTGTNGQSLTSGIVVDCSRHMNRILDIDPVRRTARVEAGVVKDKLNRALKKHGLFFAPELSTSNRATIGGMVSTDACGQGSCLYGKTSNHVLGLRIVFVDGVDWWSRALDQTALAELTARQDRIGDVYRAVDRITRDKAERIAAVFPTLNRYMTGYDLAHVRREDGRFDLNAILCGSEGTLAFIAEAELNLLPLPKHTSLINIRYSDFNAALEDARMLTGLNVASVETVDEKVLGLAKSDIVWPAIAEFFPEEDNAAANGINIVELLADDEDDMTRKIRDVTEELDHVANRERLGYTLARGHANVEAIWTMRKRAVGLLGNVEGPIRPIAFVEDTAVPPQNLAAYIREFRALLDAAGLSYGMFGHVDAGVLHVRPALDLTRPDHVQMVREISDAVVALTRKYGGVLWGEHGKGVRSEYVPEFFGDLYPSLQEIKGVFDPYNRMNPGKIATPSPSQPLLKIDEVPLRGKIDQGIGNDLRAGYDNAGYCNGNGACFDFDESSPMCPSFKATRDRRFSPKGRASLIREWLRMLREKNVDPSRETNLTRKRFAAVTSLPRRTFNSLNPRNKNDFSHQVRKAMDTCLACKACAGQCPVKVNVPAFRSKFLELYYGRYLRPTKDSLVGAIETLLPWMARARPVYNLAAGTRVGQALMRIVGLTALPTLPRLSLAKEARRLGVRIAAFENIAHHSDDDRDRVVVFVADPFTAYFEPGVALAAIRLARKMGLIPYLARPTRNGKARHVHGYLRSFDVAATKTARYLERLANAGGTLVGLDPSMTLAYRSEYKSYWSTPNAAPILLPQEWLAANLGRLAPADVMRRTAFRLLVHCTERSNIPASANQWKNVFDALGVDLETPNVGCCGMAGTFGHEVRNRPISEKLYAMSWADAVADHAGRQAMATGYSCRCQTKLIDCKTIPHPLEIIESLAAATTN
ncbi:FAD-binding and (Fe-S)-binding domain-containing protein [Rhizobium lusitanum]|uniref:D-2-hydroxyglutarate dehydrogenase YdiJ n=1 Tax=Rhizobium lusitanum TaxID=293958 RepID=UPI001959C462|nr:FAD-binding and (Fe-S)-binding domain-containing protein [Rhizobium lusitanum]MBM7046203.1 FAD-binding oxidoreductase [Rhizobium lusitanum]